MNNCKNCNQSCNNGDCGCIPQGMTTPNYCPADLPSCPDPSPCNETFDSKCVYYTGVGNECLGIDSGQTVEAVINNLAAQLTPFICLECASLIIPANNSTAVPNTQVLNWNMIPGASSYDVYLGTNSLSLPLVSLGQISTAYIPAYPLLPDTTYYWKIIPYNLAGVPVATCPTFTFNTIPAPCVNPLQDLFTKTLGFTSAEGPRTAATIITGIQNLLNAGELLTNCNLCCPDCEATHRYVLASAPLYSVYYSAVYSSTCLPPCCIEVDASLTAMNTIKEGEGTVALSTAFAAVPPNTNCCGTNFSECAARIKTLLPNKWGSIFITLGVVEESSFNGTTELCIIADFIETLLTLFTETETSDIIKALLNVGFVVDCRPEGTITSSVATYLAYLNSVSVGGCLCYEPCTP